MSTTRTDNDAKKVGGYLKEKWTIGMSRIDDDECVRAVTKVTSHKLKVPNEKHMARLISASHGTYNSGRNEYKDICQWIIDELEPHTHARNWVTVLKTLIVYHNLMLEGSDDINNKLQAKRSIFNASRFKDLADSPDGATQEGFIKQYTRYLEERIIASAACRSLGRVESDDFLQRYCSQPPAAVAAQTDALLMQLETMLAVELRNSTIDNFATLDAYKKVVGDGKRLYVVLTRRLAATLDEFTTMSPEVRKGWVSFYRRYNTATAELSTLFARMNNMDVVWGESFPELRAMPEAVIRELESGTHEDDEVKVVSLATLSGGSRAPPADDDGRKSPELFKKKPSVSPTASGAASPQDLFAKAASPAAQHPPSVSPSPTTATTRSPPPQQRDAMASLFDEPQKPQPKPAAAATNAAPFDPFAAPPAPARQSPQPQQQQQQRQSTLDIFASGPAPQQQQQQQRPPAAQQQQQQQGGFDPFAEVDRAPPRASPPPQQKTQSPPPQQGGMMDFFNSGAPANNAAQQKPKPAGGATGDSNLDAFAGSCQPTQNKRAW